MKRIFGGRWFFAFGCLSVRSTPERFARVFMGEGVSA